MRLHQKNNKLTVNGTEWFRPIYFLSYINTYPVYIIIIENNNYYSKENVKDNNEKEKRE